MNNQLYEGQGLNLSLTTTSPSAPLTDQVTRTGLLLGVAASNQAVNGNTSGQTSLCLGPAVYSLSVTGSNDAGNVAIAVGDPVYEIDGNPPTLTAQKSGYFFGFALAAVNSGATATIAVLHVTSSDVVGPIVGQKLMTRKFYCAVVVATNGATPVTVFGATVPFNCTITGVMSIAQDTTAGNITLADNNTGTVVVVAKGTTSGGVVGGVSLANTTVSAGDALTVVSSSAGNSDVIIFFQL